MTDETIELASLAGVSADRVVSGALLFPLRVLFIEPWGIFNLPSYQDYGGLL